MTSEIEPKVRDVIWRGRIHLGDQPGMYGDMTYAGVSIEMPIEIIPYPVVEGTIGEVRFLVSVEDLKLYEGYVGHLIEVFGFFEQPDDRWIRKSLATTRITRESGGMTTISLSGKIPKFASFGIRIDDEVPPGLYNDLVLTQICIESVTHYGYLGFRRPHQQPSLE